MTSHNSSPLFRFARRPQAGFTLIELMVGLAIGMLATLVVMQVFSVFEVQKRTTTGTADAQTNGNIALYNVTRDLQMAGYPLTSTGAAGVADSALECTTVADGSTTTSVGTANIAPVSILDGVGADGSDTITIRYGNASMGGIDTAITAPMAGNNASVASNLGCSPKDIALVMNGTNCALTQVVSAVMVAGTITFYDGRAATAGAAVNGAKIACLGAWKAITYAVDANGNLMRDGVPIVAGVVNIQAQYGVSTIASNNQINQWVDASGATWGTPTVADRNRIKAVRIAIVARSDTREPNIVTNTCSSRAAANPTGLCSWDATSALPPVANNAPAIDLSGSTTDWNYYRYKVFETIIPLRNVIWAQKTL